MKLIGLILAAVIAASPAAAWTLAWDANPVSEGVVGYGVYEDGVLIGDVTTGTEYDLGATVVEACWTVDAYNEFGLKSDMSNQVCVGRPSAPGSLRLIP